MTLFFCFSLFCSAVVHTPSGKVHHPKIDDNKDGTVTIRYQPTEAGLHSLEVKYNNEPIQGKAKVKITFRTSRSLSEGTVRTPQDRPLKSKFSPK